MAPNLTVSKDDLGGRERVTYVATTSIVGEKMMAFIGRHNIKLIKKTRKTKAFDLMTIQTHT